MIDCFVPDHNTTSEKLEIYKTYVGPHKNKTNKNLK